uniref:DNA end protector protein n=1 Tax=Myoviridae sp. ctCo31 TaxID=2825053 RepID=A0A8S5ULL4_9CAUD|nr:MAG TPA: DNA end protector protein [Myoviridae sp. ctCo31]
MIKAYLPVQMKSPASEVDPSEWINVIYMPLQSFV